MRVVVVTLPEKGHYHPLLGPAAELARRGAEVAFAATTDIAAELVAAGAPRVYIPPGAPPPDHGLRGAALAEVLRDPTALGAWIRTLLIDAPRAGIAPLRAILRDVRPDVVAIDTMAYDAAIAAELEGIPWVGWATSLNPVMTEVESSGSAGARSDAERCGEMIESTLVRTLRALDPARHALFAEHGLTARFRISDVLSPRGTAVFATSALVAPVADATLVGPSLGGARAGERIDPAFADGRPILYVSFGSQAWYQPARFAKLFEAAAALDLAVIAAMGDLAAAVHEPHVRAVPVVDQLAALHHAAACVTHGGANSVMEACAAGVPLLVAPICNDQPHNRAVVERAGCGRGIELDSCTAGELRDALAALVADGPERARMRAIVADYARHDGATGAAELAIGAMRRVAIGAR